MLDDHSPSTLPRTNSRKEFKQKLEGGGGGGGGEGGEPQERGSPLKHVTHSNWHPI